MPSGIYKRTQYHCKINSDAHKGLIPWNKGIKQPELGLNRLGKNNPAWKGNNILRAQRHRRIEKLLGKPNYCEICKRTDRKRYDWSNKDHKYSLNIEDWQRLCRGCHIKFDRLTKPHPNKGKSLSTEHKKKVSEALLSYYKKHKSHF